MATRPSPDTTDDDTRQLGGALRTLRDSLGLTQGQAGDAAEPVMTAQYWGMHETGKVPGIFKPSVQRKLIEALNKASEKDRATTGRPPLTVGDLQAALDAPPPPAGRMARLARELGGVAEPGAAYDASGAEAVFPTRDGAVVIRLPAAMTPEGFKDLEAYFAVFMQTKRGG